MTKKPAAKQVMSPSPFSASREREELERALLPSSSSSAAIDGQRTSPTASSATQSYVPTAVPIVYDTSNGSNDNVPSVTAEFATATIADLPPPPPPPPSDAAATGMANNYAGASASAVKMEKSEKPDYYDDDIIVRPEPPSASMYSTESTHPSAPAYNNLRPTTEQKTTASQLRAANVRGGIAYVEEISNVTRIEGQRKKGLINRTATDTQVKVANARAARKAGMADEGLTVSEDLYHTNNNVDADGDKKGVKKADEIDGDDNRSPYKQRQTKGKGGYEVSEYDVAEYETGSYDITEYKSVYD